MFKKIFSWSYYKKKQKWNKTVNKNYLGFVFELGFNMGIASCLEEKMKNEVKIHLKDESYIRSAVYSTYTKDITDVNEQNLIKQNIDYLLFKGILSGKNFFKEWLKTKVHDREYKLEYFQANFKNVFGQFNQQDQKEYFINSLETQLQIKLNVTERESLFFKGQVLRADTIILISVSQKYYLCVVDNAISVSHIQDYSNLENIKKIFQHSIYSQVSKSQFSNLAIDGVDISDMNISELLNNYMIGLASKEKPLLKMIQAGSYAYNFIKLLFTKTTIQHLTNICIVGYTDSEVCSCNLTDSQIDILETCFKHYYYSDKQHKTTTFEDKNKDLFSRVRSNFKQFFKLDENTLNKLVNFKPVSFTETFDDFQNTAAKYTFEEDTDTLRNIHAKQISKYIANKDVQLLFLTGNPGIGKTTAIVEYLKKEEGFLFLYLSPRTQVNNDILEKFLNNNKLYTDDAVYLTANSQEEKNINGVNFLASNPEKYISVKSDITFLPIDNKKKILYSTTKFKEHNDTIFSKAAEHNLGVLSKLTKAINCVISNNLSNKIISTACIQSLRKCSSGKSTATHIKTIFDTFYNENTRQVKNFDNFAIKFQNVIIMVDEITGDGAGIAFLDNLIKLVYRQIYDAIPHNEKHKVNFKILVADASITNIKVIEQHFRNSLGDNSKIYFNKNKQSNKELEIFNFQFRNKYNSICINTNSYPANKLSIEYDLLLQTCFVPDVSTISTNINNNNLNDKISNEAIDIIASKRAKQVIIYIQNLNRLAQISEIMNIKYLKKFGTQMIKNTDYIIINSILSDAEKANVLKYKDQVKFVLMTSSASRGISFPNTTRILIDVPNFNIEHNLMEILQLIYRGRGGNLDFTTKYLKFFINDTIFFNDSLDSTRIQKSLIGLFTMLIIIKIAILTRIYGSTKFKNQNISLIPTGEKAIDSSSTSLIETLSSLIIQLKRAYRRDLTNKNLENIIHQLTETFSSISIHTQGEIFNNTSLKKIQNNFHTVWDNGMDKLLDFNPLIEPIILGDLMIFPLKCSIESFLHFNNEIIRKQFIDNNLREQLLEQIQYNDNIPNTIKKDLNTALDTLIHVYTSNISKKLQDITCNDSMFIAMPIIGIFTFSEFEAFTENTLTNNRNTFKQLLYSYLRSHYNITGVLPISSNYENVPYILFKSNNLQAIRNKIYNDRYIFCSRELNLLNLLLI